VWCVYDCARRGLACAGYWYNIGIDGEISFDSGHRDHVYFLPVDGASMIASDGHMTFYAVRPDGSLWCRGQCGGQQVATPGPPHEGFRRVEGLPPLTYIESNVAPQTTCAITREGTVQCWGRCSLVLGRRCNAGAAALYAPETLPGPEGVIELAMTDTHACALTASDEVWCWGRAYGFPDDSEGEVYTSWVPQRIALPVRDR
jgi:alpha-tubulin suppressor-like RCC1 family protein